MPSDVDPVQIPFVIFELRGHRVIIDSDLAALYGVTTKRLNEQVKRNVARFPEDFSFVLGELEIGEMNRSQIATGSRKHRDPRFPPRVFTEHGAIQASNVLNSPKAVEMGVHVVRAFVRLRQALFAHGELKKQVEMLERKYERHDKEIAAVLSVIRRLMAAPPETRRGIGFTADVK
jgi:hypothetical protein